MSSLLRARSVSVSITLASFVLSSSCAAPTPAASAKAAPTAWLAQPTARSVRPVDLMPTGTAPGARHRLLASREDGSKDYALILAAGDDVWTALADFARDEHVVAARFTAIGAVRDPELGWLDPAQQLYTALRLHEQGEVLSLVGDIGIGANQKPSVHSHMVFGRKDGTTFGGHLISATVSPTLEAFVTTFPTRIEKRPDPATGLQLFDLSVP